MANCSFFKYLGPGVRLARLECASLEPTYNESQFGASKSGRSPAHLTSSVAEDLIRKRALDSILVSLNLVFLLSVTQYMIAM